MVLMEITCVFYGLFCGPTGPQTYWTLFFGGMAKKGSIDSPLDGLQPPTTPGTHITTISYMSTCVICVCILVHTYTPTLKKYVSTKGEAKGRPGGILQIVPLPRLLNITSTLVLRNLLATVVPGIFGQVTSDQKY